MIKAMKEENVFCSISFQIILKGGEVALMKAEKKIIKLHY